VTRRAPAPAGLPHASLLSPVVLETVKPPLRSIPCAPNSSIADEPVKVDTVWLKSTPTAVGRAVVH